MGARFPRSIACAAEAGCVDFAAAIGTGAIDSQTQSIDCSLREKVMTGILIARFKISNPESYRRYAAISGPAAKAAGGRYLAVGAPQTVLEGDERPDRVAVVEFDSPEKARAFYDSEAYQRARSERQDGVEARIVVMGGPDQSQRAADGWSVESWRRFWSKPDPEVARRRVPTVVRPDVVGHWPGGWGTVRGIDNYLQRVLDFMRLVPDLSLKVEEYAYGNDVAFIRWSGRGTGPTGPFECVGVDRFILRDGLVVENRIISDHEIFRQLARQANPN
jgi:uncharacterized protein (DUF1330 family)